MNAAAATYRSTSRREGVLFRAALLAGLGEEARSVVSELATAAAPADADPTCIDGGSNAMLIIGRRRRFRALVRAMRPADGPHVWRCLSAAPGERDRSDLLIFPPRYGGAYLDVRSWCGEAHNGFRRAHRRIGPYARLFSVCRGSAHVWVTWHVDRRIDLTTVLDACGFAPPWTGVGSALEPAFGRPVTPRIRPWSVGCRFEAVTAQPTAVRVGTSAWAFCRESSHKVHRLVEAISALGGDGRYAAGLYRLLRSDADDSARIGRALEVSFRPGEPPGLRAVLAVPPAQRRALKNPKELQLAQSQT